MGADDDPGLSPLERARAELERGPSIEWEETSRFGPPGRAARRGLRRVLRPYLVRRHLLDEAIVDSVGVAEQRAELARLAALAIPPPEDAIELETDVGKLWFDATDELITPLVRRTGDWEGDVARFLRAALRPGMVFVDVGANVGYFAVLASGRVGPQGTVIAFEPEPRTTQFLRANLWRNTCANSIAVPAACASTTGGAHLARNAVGLAGSVLEAQPGPTTVPVAAARLDDVLEGWRVDVLKVDIEQREHLAIAGAERLIAANPAISIVCEFWPHATELPGGQTPDGVLDSYEQLGLELCRLHFDGSATETTAADLRSDDVILTNIVLRGPEAPR